MGREQSGRSWLQPAASRVSEWGARCKGASKPLTCVKGGVILGRISLAEASDTRSSLSWSIVEARECLRMNADEQATMKGMGEMRSNCTAGC